LLTEGCTSNSEEACLTLAQALGCGRGLDKNVGEGLAILGRQCPASRSACLELAGWLDDPETQKALDGSEALQFARYYRAQTLLQAGSNTEALQLADLLTGADWAPGRSFLRAVAALNNNDAAGFRSELGELQRSRGQEPAVAVLARLTVPGNGERWPDLISAWTAAGRPDLSQGRLLVPVSQWIY